MRKLFFVFSIFFLFTLVLSSQKKSELSEVLFNEEIEDGGYSILSDDSSGIYVLNTLLQGPGTEIYNYSGYLENYDSLLKRTKSLLNKIRFGFGFNMSLESMNKATMELIGISNLGFTYLEPFVTMNFLRYLNVNVGMGVSHFKDHMPFEEAVLISWYGLFTNLPGNAKSKLSTVLYYYSGGFRVPIFSSLNIVGNYGKREVIFIRSIKNCEDCTVKRYFAKGNYVQAGFSWVTLEDKGEELLGQVDLLYSQYFDSAINHSISIGFKGYF